MKIIKHEIGRDALYKIWNSSDENMIIYVHRGEGAIVFQDKIYPMKKGTLCFIGAGKTHYTMPDDPAVYDRSKLFFGKELLKGILELFSPSDGFYNLYSKKSVIYAEIPIEFQKDAERYFSQSAEHINDREMAISAVIGLMGLLKRYSSESITAPKDAVSLAVEYINKEYMHGITLNEICAKAHMSKFSFCRKFKKSLGITVMDYLLNTRIAAAKNLLSDRDASLGEVSEQCGFSSQAYFCQSFKQSTSMTPGQYRKMMSKKLSS